MTSNCFQFFFSFKKLDDIFGILMDALFFHMHWKYNFLTLTYNFNGWNFDQFDLFVCFFALSQVKKAQFDIFKGCTKKMHFVYNNAKHSEFFCPGRSRMMFYLTFSPIQGLVYAFETTYNWINLTIYDHMLELN